MRVMAHITEVSETLVALGSRLRDLRLARGDSQAIFAQRLDVSTRTVRAIEKGDLTVAVGHWAAAWWALHRIDALRDALQEHSSLFEHADAGKRQRAPRSRKR